VAQTPTGWTSVKVRPPDRLQGTEASTGTVLEDWIFELESCFAASGIAQQSFEIQMMQTRAHWDRSVNTWWNGAQEVAYSAGRPILTWDAFLEAIRANYTPTGDVELARKELMAVCMNEVESMDSYIARVQALVNRVPRTIVPSQVAAMLLLDGIDQERFPQSWSTIFKLEQEARAKPPYSGLTFEQIRAQLPGVAAREPLKVRQRKQQSGSSTLNQGEPRKSNISNSKEKEPHETINVICFKCQEEGHYVRDCKGPEKRTCSACGLVGHLSSSCQSRKKKVASMTPGGASVQEGQ
jgi:hypothetical protein